MAISDLAAAIAAINSVASLIFCFWTPQKNTKIIATALYILTSIVIGVLIFTSGGAQSPFAASWLLIALFAGFFGITISGLMVALVIISSVFSHTNSPSGLQDIMTYLIFGISPIILSHILWHRRPEKKADNSLSALASKLSNIEGKSDVVINTIGDGVLAIGKAGTIDLINPSAQTLVGWDKGDALDLDWRSVLKLVDSSGREVGEMDNPIALALNGTRPHHTDKLSLLTVSGRKRLVSIVASPVGNGEGVIVVFRDITKEKAEEREQAEFISTASHEMRTPVASIEGYLGLALNPATANIDEKARDFITKAHQSAQHLGRLFQDLLDISKAEDGRLKNEPQIIDVSSMTGDIFEDLHMLAQEKGLRYFFKPNPSLTSEETERRLQPVFYSSVDPSHFRELVSNLIENAIKYTHSGEVVVDVSGDDKLVTVSVRDTGVGIPAEDIPHLFQKFYRVDNSDTREIGGTGLGLYLCRRLAETIGGHLRVESEYKKGSTFFLDVPRISHEDAMRKLNEESENVITEVRVQPVAAPDDTPFLQPEINSAQESMPAQTYSSMTLADIENSVVNQRPVSLAAPQRSDQQQVSVERRQE